MKHPYTLACECKRCTRELARRTLQSTLNPQFQAKPAARKRTVSHKPVWGSQEWAETRGDDLGLSNDY